MVPLGHHQHNMLLPMMNLIIGFQSYVSLFVSPWFFHHQHHAIIPIPRIIHIVILLELVSITRIVVEASEVLLALGIGQHFACG